MLATINIEDLPSEAIAATQDFFARWLPQVRDILGGEPGGLTIVLPPAAYDHADWRRAVARDLARAHAPKRINVIAGDDAAAIAATLAYLERAPGVTGQYLVIDGAAGTDGAG